MKFIIFLTFQILLLTNCKCEDKSESQKEKVLEPLTKTQITTSAPKIIDQQKEEKPFISSDITIEEFKNGTFVNVSDCLYFYQRGGIVILQSLNHTSEPNQHFTFKHDIIKDTRNPKGKCEINSTHSETFLSIKFELFNGTQEEGLIKFNATFIKTRMGYWKIVSSMAKVYKYGMKDFIFNCKHIEIPIDFSYSCKNFELESVNGKEKLIFKFNNLQMQPFYNKKVFADSFDCSTLFTLGTWMGVIVLWIFTAVVALGAYSLLSIKTMDRFDTKGKLLSLGTIDQ